MKTRNHVLTYRLNNEILTIKSKSAPQLEADFKKFAHLTDYHLFSMEEL
jgi:hypothetical protein